jgi:hypothetical protein
MKPKYTIVVRDNRTGEEVLNVDASNVHYSFTAVDSLAALKIEAESLVTEEATTPIHEILEEGFKDENTVKIYDCSHGHSWVLRPGFLADYKECEVCNEREYSND